MSQTTIVVCVVLFLFIFFILCARKSENYRYDDPPAFEIPSDYDGYFYGGPDIILPSLGNLSKDGKDICISEDQYDQWLENYYHCLNTRTEADSTHPCCMHPPPPCDSSKYVDKFIESCKPSRF